MTVTRRVGKVEQVSEPAGSPKRLLIEYVVSPEVAQPGSEVAVAELGIDIAGFIVDPSPHTVQVFDSRHGPLVMVRGVADGSASVGSDPRVVGVWLDRSKPGHADPDRSPADDGTVGAEDVAPEWSDPDVEGPERYLF